MGYLWLLKLALKCFYHFAWPLLALGYPLCASVEAIETDSYAETRDLISYWILLSLTYLFEHAFMGLLEWFQFWPYIKLMIIFWLIIPDFGRASYVYNNLIRSYISVKPQEIIGRLKNWRKLFVKKENFLLHAERYIQENGTEALEKLIASKNTTHYPDAEAANAIRATEKKETQQEEHIMHTNGKRLQIEHKDIKDLEVIEKKEIPAGKQDIPGMPNLLPSQKASPTMMETKGMVGKDPAGGELPQSSTHKEVQKEWTCAVCLVTTSCENNLNSNLQWRKHRASCEALKAKNQPVPQKQRNDQLKEEMKQKNIINQHENIEEKNSQYLQGNLHAQTSREPEKSMLNDPIKQKTITGQEKKSKCDEKGLHAPTNKSDQLNVKSKNGESIVKNGLKGKVMIYQEKGQDLQNNLGKHVMVNHSKLRCEICNVSCTREADMASHLNGRKHLAQIQIRSGGIN